MQQEPPHALIATLERLEVTTASRVKKMGRRVRRLARGLPLFESVWVDALAQARILTPFQAAEINAGRGDSLRIGPYVVCRRLPSAGYAECHLAREIQSRRTVRLAIVRPPEGRLAETIGRLEALAASSKPLTLSAVAPIRRVGVDGDRVWTASEHVAGRTAADWMVFNGRFPPEAVLEIARQMLTGLVALERVRVCHGDISAMGLILNRGGDAVLVEPGLRGIVRPEEGYAYAELLPEAYDYLAPERIREGSPPSSLSEVYACGCLWWHLLAGRPPVPGGSSLAKLRAAEAARIGDIRQLAPDAPEVLVAAVASSIQREPSRRPQSLEQLAGLLGPPTRGGRRAVARCLSPHGWRSAPWARSSRLAGTSKKKAGRLTAVGGLFAAAALGWSVWNPGLGVTSPNPSAGKEAAVEGALADPGGWKMEAGIGESAGGGDTVAATRRVPQPAGGTGPVPATIGVRESDVGGREPGTSEDSRRSPPGSHPSDPLVLAGGGPVRLESLELHAGQCVGGQADCRPTIVVPETGLVVRPEGVCFQNVDFLWSRDSGSGEQGSNGGRPASDPRPVAPCIVHLLAAQAEFRGCSFRTNTTRDPPVAIRWTYAADQDREGLSLPNGRLRLSDCVFGQPGTAVACETLGARVLDVNNVLHLGAGALVELDHCPGPDEPTLIRLSKVTLRDSGPLLECRYERIPDRPGSLSIEAAGCAFVPRSESALLSFAGPTSPEQLLWAVQWTGQGSLVSPETIVAAWQPPEGRPRVLDDAVAAIAGLVRSEVGFAGPAETGPAASQTVRWQVPVRSGDPPGIEPRLLGWPER